MNEVKKLSLDDAITIGLREFREIYPDGAIPIEIEDQINLTAQPGDEWHRVLVTFSINETPEPFIFFECRVSAESGNAKVLIARSVSDLDNMTFATSDHA